MAEYLIPVMSVGYILLSLGVLVHNASAVPTALQSIFVGAFSPKAFTGGAVGTAFLTLRIGVSRGVFTNEAGMGTASIAHAGANTRHPAEQGLYGIFEVFADTLVICTMTALVILTSGISVPYGADAGAELTVAAFVSVYGGWVTIFWPCPWRSSPLLPSWVGGCTESAVRNTFWGTGAFAPLPSFTPQRQSSAP